MKTLENTPDRLVLRHIPLGSGALILAVSILPMVWGWALWRAGQPAGGAVLIGIGLLLLFGCFGVFAKTLRITLDRPSNLAQVSQTGLFGTRRKDHRLADFHGATLQSTVIKRKPGDLSRQRPSQRNKPEPRVWRAAFASKTGAPVPITEIYGSEKTARAAASAINGWFGAPASS